MAKGHKEMEGPGAGDIKMVVGTGVRVVGPKMWTPALGKGGGRRRR